MSDWLPVFGTLAGVVVTGVISFALYWLSNHHAKDTLILKLSEERAKWAVEYELDRIQKFYVTAEKLLAAVVALRIQQAWDKGTRPPPPWVLSYNDARGGIEKALDLAGSEVLLLNEKIRSEYRASLKGYNDWFLAEGKEDCVKSLHNLENDLTGFIEYLANHYRETFDRRRHGTDI